MNHPEFPSEKSLIESMKQRSAKWVERFPDGYNTDFQKHFEASLVELQAEILKHEPFLLIASCAYENLFGSNTQARSGFQPRTLEQHHVELLQTMILRNPIDAYSDPNSVFAEKDTIEQALTEALITYVLQRQKAADQKHAELGAIISSTQLHTLSLRNSGYPQQLLATVERLYRPLESRIFQSLGFKPSDLARMLFRLVALTEDKASNELNRFLLPILLANSLEELQNLTASNPDLEQAAKFLPIAQEQGWPIEQFYFIYESWWRLRLPDVFTLTFEEIKGCYPGAVDDLVLKNILDGWSLELGALAEVNTEHVIMANPVWDRPLIKLPDNHFFLPIGNLLIGFAYRLIFDSVAADSNIAVDLPDRKAKFLENEVENLSRQYFPSTELLVNMQWQDATAKGENDVVVLLPPYALIIEAKSHAMDVKSKRGAPQSLKESLGKLVQEPAIQSAGLIAWVERNPGRNTVSTKYGDREIDCSAFTEFIQLSVTLEDLSYQASNWQSLALAGIIDPGSKPVPNVRLTDLECVFEILPSQSERLHYWLRRQEIEGVAISSDELGWLKLYLDNRIMFSPTDEFLHLPLLPLYGQVFNDYFLRHDTLIDVPKPVSLLPLEISTAIQLAEAERIDRWIYLGLVLLDLRNEQQNLLVQLIQGVRSGKASQKFSDVGFDCIYGGSDTESLAFCAAVHVTTDNAAALAKYVLRDSSLQIVIVFGCASRDEKVPLSFVRVFSR